MSIEHAPKAGERPLSQGTPDAAARLAQLGLTHRYLTVTQACDFWQIDRSTHYRKAREGLLPPVLKIGGLRRIDALDHRFAPAPAEAG